MDGASCEQLAGALGRMVVTRGLWVEWARLFGEEVCDTLVLFKEHWTLFDPLLPLGTVRDFQRDFDAIGDMDSEGVQKAQKLALAFWEQVCGTVNRENFFNVLMEFLRHGESVSPERHVFSSLARRPAGGLSRGERHLRGALDQVHARVLAGAGQGGRAPVLGLPDGLLGPPRGSSGAYFATARRRGRTSDLGREGDRPPLAQRHPLRPERRGAPAEDSLGPGRRVQAAGRAAHAPLRAHLR